MADYSKEEIKRIEGKWREEWEKRGVYKVDNQSGKPKYYVLDMFPYPSAPAFTSDTPWVISLLTSFPATSV